MTYDRRMQNIRLAREVEAGAIDAGDTMILQAAQRVIVALGFMRKPDAADWRLIVDFAHDALPPQR